MQNINGLKIYTRLQSEFFWLFGVLHKTVLVSIAVYFFSGCRKLIEVDLPIDRNSVESVYSDKSTATSALSAVYSLINAGDGSGFTGNYGISIRSALLADELTPINIQAPVVAEYLFSYNAKDGWPTWWLITYRDYIYQLNAVIEGIDKSKALPSYAKSVLKGEAKFTRAWLYFYLLNFYGDVPLVLNTNFKENQNIPRTDKEQVYQQIIKDLHEAQVLLTESYLGKDLVLTTDERIRPNRFAATALLARVYLYENKWAEAEEEASKIISNTNFELLPDLNAVFQKNSRETIWAMQPNPKDNTGSNTPDAKSLINPFGFLEPSYNLSNLLLNSFETGDLRRSYWVLQKPSGRIVSYKYKQGYGTKIQLEYTIVLRLAEQYLIRSEARAMQGRLVGDNSAEGDINLIRRRAGLLDIKVSSQSEILEAIASERRKELFLEWGDRWLNSKRTNKLEEVISKIPEKAAAWQPFKALLPIPFEDFKFNPALRGHQNPGYNEQP